ncbi:MAG: exosome complex exonuclease Rrp41 [Thermoplasmata archaeon]|nr:MAG: exosome complex exonuclease Rrp41 [Thermoplasmata archaeon]HDJ26737.1 exosome complex exonuclease Rrp41 [Aciduliprofundum sp.]
MDEEGRRIDGRRPDELRPIKMKVGVLTRADGSAYLQWGKNKVLAAVYGPREVFPKHLQDPERALLRARYNMASFSVEERKRPGPDRRSIELSKVISEALRAAVFVEQFPKTSIDVFIEILQADAGTRIAGLVAASAALADAGIPMKDLVTGMTVGKVEDTLILDLCKEEDNYGQADLPIAIIPRTGEIVLLQMDGHMTQEEIDRALDMAIRGAMKVYEIQKRALLERYERLVREKEYIADISEV